MSLLSLPSTVLLEIASAIPGRSLGSLLQTRKCIFSSADTQRAWKQIAGPRGSLVDYTNQQLAVVHDRVRSLLPRSMDEFRGEPDPPAQPLPYRVFHEFAFTWAFFWQDGEKLQSATIEHISCFSYDDPDPPLEVFERSKFGFPIFPENEAAAALTPHLKRSQDYAPTPGTDPGSARELASRFINSWDVGAMLVCTRKRDGATFELNRFTEGFDHWDGINTAVGPSTGYGSLTLVAGTGLLDLGFLNSSGLDVVDCNAHLVFEKNGDLRYITGDFYGLQHITGAKISVSDEFVRTYLHAKCDYMSSPRGRRA